MKWNVIKSVFMYLWLQCRLISDTKKKLYIKRMKSAPSVLPQQQQMISRVFEGSTNIILTVCVLLLC